MVEVLHETLRKVFHSISRGHMAYIKDLKELSLRRLREWDREQHGNSKNPETVSKLYEVS